MAQSTFSRSDVAHTCRYRSEFVLKGSARRMDTFLRAIDQQSLLIMIALRLKLNRLPEPPANLRCTRLAFDRSRAEAARYRRCADSSGSRIPNDGLFGTPCRSCSCPILGCVAQTV